MDAVGCLLASEQLVRSHSSTAVAGWCWNLLKSLRNNSKKLVTGGSGLIASGDGHCFAGVLRAWRLGYQDGRPTQTIAPAERLPECSADFRRCGTAFKVASALWGPYFADRGPASFRVSDPTGALNMLRNAGKRWATREDLALRMPGTRP